MSDHATYQEGINLSSALHPLFSRFKFRFERSRFFHSLTQSSAPFVRRVRWIAAAATAHFNAEGDPSRENLDNFRVRDDPCFAEATLSFPTFCQSCLFSFHFGEAAPVCHPKPPEPLNSSLGGIDWQAHPRERAFVQLVPAQ